MHRILSVVVVSVVLTGLLAGCALLPGARRPASTGAPGPSSEQARSTDEAIAAIEEVTGVAARISPANDGSTRYLAVNLELDETYDAGVVPERRANRDAALLDFVLAQVWSQTEDAPERFVTLRVTGAGRDTAWVTDTLTTLGVATIPYGGDVVSLRGVDLDDRYGTWPGEVPALPDDLAGEG
ncbi:hypothetical protein A4X17_07785 [Plantibacter sp. H53]|uniref:hypothetical protein n=1 Tax=Plantibacter sp. H53 TaxID=1827323 RepID=UPI0007D9F2E0|nr:hypothetical protein [Plantibacter sp. H53]OAN27689.1 hypothetical protein A4X17_07785 [Plantibacter sp. H53]